MAFSPPFAALDLTTSNSLFVNLLVEPAGNSELVFCELPWVFSSLRRHPQKPGSPGFTNTQHLPLSAFLTPSGVYFSCDLAALFRAAAARGIFAFRAFPSRMASDRLRSRSPHGVTRPYRHSTSTRRTEPRSNTVPLAPLAVDDSTIRRASLATVRVASWVYHSKVRICRRGV